MGDLTPRRSRLPRRQREQRAYRLVLATGAFGVVAVVGVVLAIAGVLSWAPGIIAALVALACYFFLRRTLS